MLRKLLLSHSFNLKRSFLFIIFIFFVQIGFGATWSFNTLYKGTGSSYNENTNSITSLVGVTGTNFQLIQDGYTNFTGNSFNARITYLDGTNVSRTIYVNVNRRDKVSGPAPNSLSFYCTVFNSDFSASNGEAYLMVVPGKESNYSAGSTVPTSSDPVDDALNDIVTLSPTMTVTSSLTSFNTCQGTASLSQSFTVSGSNLSNNIVVTAPTGYNVSLSSASGYGSSVTINKGTGNVATTTVYVRLTGASSGTFTDNVTVASTGYGTKNVAVTGTVTALPTIITSTGASSGTSPATLSLNATASAGATINWYSTSSGGSSIGTGSPWTTPSISSTTTYYVGATNGSCTSTRVAVEASISGSSDITLTESINAFEACQNSASTAQTFTVSGESLTDNIVLTAPTGFEISTDGSNYTSTITLNQASGTVATTTIYVRMAALNSDPTSANLTVTSTGASTRNIYLSGTVNAIPTVSSTSGGSTCGTGSVTLSATASVGTINWYSAETEGTLLLASSSTYNPSVSETTTFYAEAVNGSCTSVSRTPVTATVLALPTFSYTMNGNRCGPGSVTLNAGTSSGTISWFAQSSGGEALGTGGSFNTPSISETTTYYASIFDGTCTSAPRTAFTATVSAVPTFTSTTDGSRCGSGTVTLSAAASSGTINWFANVSGGESIGTGTSFTTPAISITTTYYASIIDGSCSSAGRTPVVATINTAATGGTLSGGSSMCSSGGSVVLTLGGYSGTIVKWQTSRFADFSADVTDITNTNSTYTVSNITSTRYYRVVVGSTGCTDVYSTVATVGVGNNPGSFGNALHLDGVNDYVSFGVNSPSFPVSGNITVETWFKTNSPANDLNLFGWTSSSSNDNIQFRIGDIGKFEFGMHNYVDVENPNGWNSIRSNAAVNDGQWHHMAMVRNNHTISLYIDGNLQDTLTLQKNMYVDRFWIGTVGSDRWPGTIDEIRIWNAAKTQTQIRQSMNVELAGNETNLSAYYNFNQGIADGNNGTITTITDVSGNGKTGTLENFSLSGTTSNFVSSYSYTIQAIEGITLACIGASNELTDLTYGGTWTSSNTSVATINATTGLTSNLAVGSTTITYTLTSGAGCTTSTTAILTVLATPTVTVTPTTTIAIGIQTVTLTASGAVTYSWSPATDLNITTGATVISSPTANRTYTVTGTAVNGCTATAQSVITFSPDTDGDGVSDEQEITDGTDPNDFCSYKASSQDLTLTSNEWRTSDCDGDGKQNSLDSEPTNFCVDGEAGTIPALGSTAYDTYFRNGDCDGDGIPNHAETNGSGLPLDFDGDGIPNYLDLDSDNDGIPDSYEAGQYPNTPAHSDSDAWANYQDLDSDNDGISDNEEGIIDTDGDGIPNFLDLDSDGDGILDAWEAIDVFAANRDDNYDGQVDKNGVFIDTNYDGWADISQGQKAVDTDGDGIPDYKDLDSDNDCIPDAVEKTSDMDNDFRPNYRDTDSDGDGIPDRVEAGNCSNPIDTDGDGMPDYLDLDSDNDGIPDAVEKGIDGNNPVDTDGDGTPDFRDLDSDNDGIPDAVEKGADGNNPVDTDKDGTPDYRDLDSDNDGIPDAVEKGADGNNPVDTDKDGTPDYRDLDSDNDGIPDEVEKGADGNNPIDTDGDGTPDYRDLDSDNDGIPDTYEKGTDGNNPVDTDKDGIPDYRDLDSDNDGIPDVIEAGADPKNPVDTDKDGIPDFRDLDSDNDGIPDTIEKGPDGANPIDTDKDGTPDYRDLDSDNDGIPDTVEKGPNGNTPLDTDKDGIPDYRDLDSDNDGIPDAVEKGPNGNTPLDTDKDGTPDYRDIDSDNDTIPDSIEKGPDGNNPVDTDSDGTPDFRDLDSDNDTYSDQKEAGPNPNSPLDTDKDGKYDFRDVDSDGDGILDKDEDNLDLGNLPDCDKDGIENRLDPDTCEVFTTQGISPNGDGKNDKLIIPGVFRYSNKLTIFNRWGDVVYEKENYRNDWSGETNTGTKVLTDDGLLPDGTYYYVIDFYGARPSIGSFILINRTK